MMVNRIKKKKNKTISNKFIAENHNFPTQILVVLAAVLGTIIYRISIVSAVYSGSGGFLKTHAKIFTTITAATINLIIIMILTRVS